MRASNLTRGAGIESPYAGARTVGLVRKLRERARKVRWMAAQMSRDEDRARLLQFAEEIEQRADALEHRLSSGEKDDGR
jgi:hypothetical protein